MIHWQKQQHWAEGWRESLCGQRLPMRGPQAGKFTGSIQKLTCARCLELRIKKLRFLIAQAEGRLLAMVRGEIGEGVYSSPASD